MSVQWNGLFTHVSIETVGSGSSQGDGGYSGQHRDVYAHGCLSW
jgi:hypothetical protein